MKKLFTIFSLFAFVIMISSTSIASVKQDNPAAKKTETKACCKKADAKSTCCKKGDAKCCKGDKKDCPMTKDGKCTKTGTKECPKKTEEKK